MNENPASTRFLSNVHLTSITLAERWKNVCATQGMDEILMFIIPHCDKLASHIFNTNRPGTQNFRVNLAGHPCCVMHARFKQMCKILWVDMAGKTGLARASIYFVNPIWMNQLTEFLFGYFSSKSSNVLTIHFPGFVLFLFVLLELASIVAWIYLDEKQIREFRTPGIHLIEKQCEVEFTAARLVSTFIPCIILIIATFCAFRERNADHSFYEVNFCLNSEILTFTFVFM